MNFNRRQQRFSIRKFSFGAASVLLGTVVFATTLSSSQVSAEESSIVTA